MQIHELNTFEGIPSGTDYLALDAGFDTTKISAKKLLERSVPMPTENNTPDPGESGQLLRSKGDGSTEWSDVGLPTDEQTAQAVSDWLDDHPEATTTVLDNSLSIVKMIKGTLGYVTPSMFGAAGDGVTVDNAALNDCFAFCVANGLMCFGEYKTYLIDDSTASLCGHFGVMVGGGIRITGCNFKLKGGCPDMTTLLACKYDSKPFLIENCTFEGELRTITSGTEDGGNHGIIFCDGTTMFPTDWQDFADITVRYCDFINIQSYGIFPTPINNKLTVKGCNFSCHGPAILTYATDSIVEDCTYTGLVGQNNVIYTLAIDEIENFSNVTSYKKNVTIRNSSSSWEIYHIQHYPQRSVVYGNVLIDSCKTRNTLIQTYNADSPHSISIDKINLINCSSDGGGTTEDPSISLVSLLDTDVVIRNFNLTANILRFVGNTINLLFDDCLINYQIGAFNNSFKNVTFNRCTFDGIFSDGIMTSRWGTISTCSELLFCNCFIKSPSYVLRGIDADNIFVNGMVGSKDYEIRLFFADTATDTNIYVDGLIMPVANPEWDYFIENITGKAVIRGMSAGINTNSVAGGVTKEVTTIPTT